MNRSYTPNHLHPSIVPSVLLSHLSPDKLSDLSRSRRPTSNMPFGLNVSDATAVPQLLYSRNGAWAADIVDHPYTADFFPRHAEGQSPKVRFSKLFLSFSLRTQSFPRRFYGSVVPIPEYQKQCSQSLHQATSSSIGISQSKSFQLTRYFC